MVISGLTFFEELLKHQTIVVPGIFFEINPSHRRDLFRSPCHHFIRLSFGPPLKDLDLGMSSVAVSFLTANILPGLDAMERVLRKARKEGTRTFGHGYHKSADVDHGDASVN